MSSIVTASAFVLFLLFTFSQARDILVGGKTDSWKIPPSQSESLNQWAEKNRFKIGDSLVWKFNQEKGSVLQVTRNDYMTCNGSNPLVKHENGNAKVELDRSGPYFFISEDEEHCEKGQKLIVIVLSKKHMFRGNSPAPSPMEVDGPAVAPTSGATIGLKNGFRGVLVVALGSFLWMLIC